MQVRQNRMNVRASCTITHRFPRVSYRYRKGLGTAVVDVPYSSTRLAIAVFNVSGHYINIAFFIYFLFYFILHARGQIITRGCNRFIAVSEYNDIECSVESTCTLSAL